MFEASINRAEHNDENDTRDTIERIAQMRVEKAHLLGFKTYADYVLEDSMAKTPDKAFKLMADVGAGGVAKAKREAAKMQAIAKKQGVAKLEPWDWQFFSEQVRKSEYKLDQNEIKQYFLLDRVLQDGVFFAANKMYGITFKERHDIPVYQPDVRVFEVFDKDGTSMALFYADYFKRDNKAGGAWMSSFVDQSDLFGTKPVVFNVANLHQARAGTTRADFARRRHHHVPRVRPRAARHVLAREISADLGHVGAARFRRVPVAVQRTLGR